MMFSFLLIFLIIFSPFLAEASIFFDTGWINASDPRIEGWKSNTCFGETEVIVAHGNNMIFRYPFPAGNFFIDFVASYGQRQGQPEQINENFNIRTSSDIEFVADKDNNWYSGDCSQDQQTYKLYTNIAGRALRFVDNDTLLFEGLGDSIHITKIRVYGIIDQFISVDLKGNGSDGPLTLNYGTNLTLTWTSSNATHCTASGAWSGSKPLSGSEVITNLNVGTYTFTLTCSNFETSASDSVVVNVIPNSPSVRTLPAVETL